MVKIMEYLQKSAEYEDILWMEEIRHQLIDGLSHYL